MKRIHDALDKALAEMDEVRMKRGLKTVSQENEVDPIQRCLDPAFDAIAEERGENTNLILAMALLEIAETCISTD